MNKSNQSYRITLRGPRTREYYYRDATGWVKVSSRDRVFRASAEQVLNHLLPALVVGNAQGLEVRVEHDDATDWPERTARKARDA